MRSDLLGGGIGGGGYLEDHPTLDTWLIIMVIVTPLRIGLWDPFQIALFWLIHGGDPNHLLTGMILQVRYFPQK